MVLVNYLVLYFYNQALSYIEIVVLDIFHTVDKVEQEEVEDKVHMSLYKLLDSLLLQLLGDKLDTLVEQFLILKYINFHRLVVSRVVVLLRVQNNFLHFDSLADVDRFVDFD